MYKVSVSDTCVDVSNIDMPSCYIAADQYPASRA